MGVKALYIYMGYNEETGMLFAMQETSVPPSQALPILNQNAYGDLYLPIDFFNAELAERYYKGGVFYEDAEFTVVISDPVNYVRPE